MAFLRLDYYILDFTEAYAPDGEYLEAQIARVPDIVLLWSACGVFHLHANPGSGGRHLGYLGVEQSLNGIKRGSWRIQN